MILKLSVPQLLSCSIMTINWFLFAVESLEGSESESEENADLLTRERLQQLDAGKDNLRKEGMLSEEKIKSIMSFLDEVETADRISEIDHVIIFYYTRII